MTKVCALGNRSQRVRADGGLNRAGFVSLMLLAMLLKEPEAREALAAWARSGLSEAAFCAREGYSRSRLRYWSERLGERPAVPTPRVSFVPVTLGDRVVARHIELERDGAFARTSTSCTWRGLLLRWRREIRRADTVARHEGIVGDRPRGRSQGHQWAVYAGSVAVTTARTRASRRRSRRGYRGTETSARQRRVDHGGDGAQGGSHRST